MTGNEGKDSVIVAPKAFLLMAMHAAGHSTSSVHGILVGSRSGNKVEVSDAFPVCHETPTKPLVETALALVQSHLDGSSTPSNIIGWYTAPEILGDDQPGPVALRIASNLADKSGEPVLLMIKNEGLGQLVKGTETPASTAIQAFGKNFGKQWMDPLKVTVLEEAAVTKAIIELHSKRVLIDDLNDHWKGAMSADWPASAALLKQTEKYF
jgi:hypothetical protein